MFKFLSMILLPSGIIRYQKTELNYNFIIQDVDVIVLAAGHFPVPGEKKHSVFKKNLPVVLDMAYECAHHNPKAAVVVLTPPGTRNVPMISEVIFSFIIIL